MAVGQTFSALLPWYRCLNPTEVDPGTDICFFTTLGQMAQSKKKTPGQTFTALLPWDRWLSPKEDPGTDIYCFTTLGQMAQSKKKPPRQTFTALPPWDRWLSPKRSPRDRHLLLYHPGADGSVQKEAPGTDIYCFTTLGQMAQSKKKTPGQTFTALLPWDRWLSPKRRPRDRHLLLYYPGTDAQSNQSRLWDGRHFTAVV